MEYYYAIVDAARVDEMPAMLFELEADPEYRSLFFETPQEELIDVAPFLVKLEEGSAFFSWLLEEQWGNSWGVFLTSEADFEDVFVHLKGLMKVEAPNDERLFFRFYDPRVLRVFLPTCNTEELKQMFGCLDSFLLEGEDASFLQFVNGMDGLQVESISQGTSDA